MIIPGPGVVSYEERLVASFQVAPLCVCCPLADETLYERLFIRCLISPPPPSGDLGRYGLEVTLYDLSVELRLIGQQGPSYQDTWG